MSAVSTTTIPPGFDPNGRLSELVVLRFESGNELLIHAMEVRSYYLGVLAMILATPHQRWTADDDRRNTLIVRDNRRGGARRVVPAVDVDMHADVPSPDRKLLLGLGDTPIPVSALFDVDGRLDSSSRRKTYWKVLHWKQSTTQPKRHSLH